MNKVEIENHNLDYKVGDLFIDTKTSSIYILTQLGNNEYKAINLETGGIRTIIPKITIKDAVKELSFLGRNATIKIKF